MTDTGSVRGNRATSGRECESAGFPPGQNRVMSREPHPYLGGELVVVIDCAHLDRSAAFWTGALGYIRDGAAAGRYQSLLPADGTGRQFCAIRSYLSTAAKHGLNFFDALVMLAEGEPWTPTVT